MKKLAYFILAIPIIMASCSRDPIADFFVSRNIVDVGEVIYFTNNSIDADYFEWDFGDGTRQNSFDASHIYTEEGSYNVSLFAYNGKHRVD
ncbi:MAG: PKD domain-containing protein, partial [Bacteroidales bacterium]|nr:PKD domain-containing protein [Bacteroidales bacterium]